MQRFVSGLHKRYLKKDPTLCLSHPSFYHRWKFEYASILVLHEGTRNATTGQVVRRERPGNVPYITPTTVPAIALNVPEAGPWVHKAPTDRTTHAVRLEQVTPRFASIVVKLMGDGLQYAIAQ